jgi:hypothetical protein
MTFHHSFWILAMALVFGEADPASSQTSRSELEPATQMQSINPLRLDLRQEDRFVLSDGVAAAAAARAFDDLLAERTPEPGTLSASGLALHQGSGWRALSDDPQDPAGRGLYAYRPDGLALMISAPHQFRDLRTGRIAGLLFDELGLEAAAFNTAPRDLLLIDGSLSDLGKLEGSQFNLFHLAFHAARPDSRIVQLHGFAREKRKTVAGRQADVIVSNGTRRPDRTTVEVTECLLRAGFIARHYPDEVSELGGTTNVTVAELIGAGAPVGTFLHVETSRELRDRLAADEALRFVFGSCLGMGI